MFDGPADGVGFSAHGDVLGAVNKGPLPAGKEGIVQHGSVLCGWQGANHSAILRRGIVGILPLLGTDMLWKVAERVNKALRGGVLVLEWRRYPS